MKISLVSSCRITYENNFIFAFYSVQMPYMIREEYKEETTMLSSLCTYVLKLILLFNSIPTQIII